MAEDNKDLRLFNPFIHHVNLCDECGVRIQDDNREVVLLIGPPLLGPFGWLPVPTCLFCSSACRDSYAQKHPLYHGPIPDEIRLRDES